MKSKPEKKLPNKDADSSKIYKELNELKKRLFLLEESNINN